MHFSVTEPSRGETPVIVEVPHAGLGLDPESLAWTTAPARSVGHDADLYVDALFRDASKAGATLLAAQLSRYVCDLNRGETDVDEISAVNGTGRRAPHGLIWRQTTSEQPALLRTLPESEVRRRITCFYRPYHEALRTLIERKLKRFGTAMLLCAHSMPSRSRRPSAGAPSAQVVVGSRNRTSADGTYIDLVADLASERGWSTAHDDPYAGGFTTRHYGEPARGVHAVQLELSRALYMDEASLATSPVGFGETVEYCQGLVARLGELAARAPTTATCELERK